jgi:perosamine synthetase
MSVAAQRESLALYGGTPVRKTLLPYGRQSIDETDIAAVVETLRSDWLTTGPKVGEFEEAFAAQVKAKHAVVFNSGTAALHAAVFAAGLQAGDEAITTPLTFCATSNAVLYQQGHPIFADVRPDTLNLDPVLAAARITPRTKAILPVDYAGHPADMDAFMSLADKHGLVIIEDAAHSLGAEYRKRRVGSLAHMTTFSLHPVKHITTGEGGMVCTDSAELAKQLRLFRSHGINSDPRARQTSGQWHYEMVALGFNYRLPDIACALGISQLRRLDSNLSRRREIARRYTEVFSKFPGVTPPAVTDEALPAWHLYPIRLELEKLSVGRADVFKALRAENLGVNVHYIPVHLHPYYRQNLAGAPGQMPIAEDAYERLISLPMFHAMTDQDVNDVIAAVTKVVSAFLL